MHCATFRDELRTALDLDENFAAEEIEGILDEAAADPAIQEFTGGLNRVVWSGVVLELAWELTKVIATPRLVEGR